MILPNQLTVLRIILTPFVIYFLLSEILYFKEIGLIIYLIAALTDWYDGWLARKFDYITTWGKVWDPIADKILTSATFITLAISGILAWWAVALIALRDIIITGLRSYAEHKKKSFPTSKYAKIKTLVQMVFLYFVLISYVFSQSTFLSSTVRDFFYLLYNNIWCDSVFYAVTVITVHSGYTYIKDNFMIIKELLSRQ